MNPRLTWERHVTMLLRLRDLEDQVDELKRIDSEIIAVARKLDEQDPCIDATVIEEGRT